MSKNYYEFTYIINPVLEEDKFKETVDKVTKLIEKHGGEIDEVDEWGLRQFAYNINKKGSGYYVNMYFTADAEAIAPIERQLRIDDDILRYLTLKYDAKMLRHRELQKKNEIPDVFAIEDEDEETEDDD
ncbi:MAG: 30S ribosomal protein S6 [Gracilimonas sp.]|uniref:30S ribosomal protein S6 n=1 Tax=Gracilimonas sp. TaxID=1974203 RepID=UPI0019B32131|nr:30S ribosomal protein S6 [Gracilimonas sp.]MBD3616258.1 30S ribosomal protein S6 [Gracilimonas sp.]